ncbi:MAG: hypothetical protein O7G87_22225 [bacterium]|nr:hypothetical protein [bacterium]
MKIWQAARFKAGCLGLLVVLLAMWSCGRERVNPIDPNFGGSESLSPPTNIRATGDIGQIALTWNPVASTTLKGYGVFRSTSSTGDYVQLRGESTELGVTTGQTTFVDTTLNLSTAKIYFYKLNTIDTEGRISELSIFVSAEALEDKRPPGTPTNLSAVADEVTSNVTLTWTAPLTDANTQPLTGLNEFKVFRSKDSQDSFILIGTVSGDSTSFVDRSSLEQDAVYFYRVSAQDKEANEGGRSQPASITLATTAAAPTPTGVRVTSGVGEVTVTWNPVDEANLLGYLVLRSTSTQEAFTPVTSDTLFTTGQTEYVDKDVRADQVYFYRIQAVVQDPEKGLVRGEASTFVDGTTLSIGIPTGLNAAEGIGEVTVNWNAVDEPNLIGYLVLRSLSTQAAFVPVTSDTIFTTGQTQYIDQNVQPDQVYFYKIQTVVQDPDRGIVRGEASGFIDGKSLADQNPPAAPSDLIVTLDDNNFRLIQLNWTAPTQDSNGGDLTSLASFQVFRSRESSSSFSLLTTLAATQTAFQDTSVELLTNYFYAISAVDSVGNVGPRSQSVSVTTKGLAVPSNLAATDGIQKITLNWSANSEPELTGYEILRYNEPTNVNPNATFSSVLTTYVDTPVVADQTFVYRIRAVGTNSISSELSTFVSATAEAPAPVLAAPTNVSATADIGRITLSWSANSETELIGYQVLRFTSPEETTANMTFNTVQTTLVDSPLAEGVVWVYRVRALGTGSAQSDLSLFASAQVPIDSRAPGTPSALSATLRSSSTIRLLWSAPKTDANGQDLSGLSGFIIYRATGSSSSGFEAVTQVDSTRRSYEDGNLEFNTAYLYQISAVDANGNEGSRTGSVSQTTSTQGSSIAAPTNVTATYVAASGNNPQKVTLTWTNPSAFDSFLIQRAEVGQSSTVTFFTIELAQSSSPYDDETISSSKTYVYRISANSSGQISDPSDVAVVVIP